MMGRGRGLTTQLLGQVMMSALLGALSRGQAQEVGKLEVPLVARHEEGVTQPREAVISGEVEQVSVVLVLTLTNVSANVIRSTALELCVQKIGDPTLLL